MWVKRRRQERCFWMDCTDWSIAVMTVLGCVLLLSARHGLLRAVGKVAALEDKIGDNGACGDIGYCAHAWATHGKPSVANAHPHSSGKVHIVHNGIIENYQQLKDALIKKGYVFRSETDTEVVAHLIMKSPRDTTLRRRCIARCGSCVAPMLWLSCTRDHPDTLIAARNSSPVGGGHCAECVCGGVRRGGDCCLYGPWCTPMMVK